MKGMQQTVLETLARIGRMDVDELRDQWRALFGTEPPASYAKAQLVRRLAWRVQELRFGGLSDRARQRLSEIADGDDLACGKKRSPKPRKRSSLAPGTRLVRQWRGVEHVVTALADGGFEWDGRCYRTLSAVAGAMTGQHVSGPRFFGLASTNKEDA
jgi:hypothetical protein